MAFDDFNHVADDVGGADVLAQVLASVDPIGGTGSVAVGAGLAEKPTPGVDVPEDVLVFEGEANGVVLGNPIALCDRVRNASMAGGGVVDASRIPAQQVEILLVFGLDAQLIGGLGH